MTADRARITIFDTTLRDGEQSPGCSMNQQEKLRLAHQLDRLGVDVIEAGFPIASDGDFDSVKAIASAVRRPIIAGLARACRPDIERAWEALRVRGTPAHPCVSGHFRHSLEIQAANHARSMCRAGAGSDSLRKIPL